MTKKKPALILQFNLFESEEFEIRFYPSRWNSVAREYAVFHHGKIERIFTKIKYARDYIKYQQKQKA